MLDPFSESSGTTFTKMEEGTWKDIPGFEGLYAVSSIGRVRSYDMKIPVRGGIQTRKGRVLKPMVNVDGYYIVMLCKNGTRRYWRIHRLVAMAFIPNPNNYPVINHKNEIKTDNRVENLEWCTVAYNQSYNNRQCRAASTRMKNKKGFKAVLQYDMNYNLICMHESTASAARAVGCYQGAISNNCIGRSKSAGGFRWEYASGTNFEVDNKKQ